MMNLYMTEMMNSAVYAARMNMSELVEMELDMVPAERNEVRRTESHCVDGDAAARAKAKLTALVDRYNIMLDTCALLSADFLLLLEHLLPVLKEAGKSLLVPFCVVMELDTLGRYKPELTQKINDVVLRLLELKREGLVTICGERSGDHGERGKVTAIMAQLAQGEVLVVTQDQDLSHKLIEISSLGLAGGRIVAVSRINRHGYLSRYQKEGRVFVDGTRSDGAKVWQRCTCADCGDEFIIRDKERDYYLSNALELPRRCPTCRKLRKMAAGRESLQQAS